MDVVTRANLQQFVEQNDIHESEDIQFEKFSTYCVLSELLDDALDIEGVSTRGDGDCALDALAIVVNGVLVTDQAQVSDILDNNRYLDVQFFFIQATTSSQFDSQKINSFFFGIEDFFQDVPRLPANDMIKSARLIKDELYINAASFKRGNPDIFAYYCCTGNWQEQDHATAVMEAFKGRLQSTNLVEDISVQMIGARELQRLYRSSMNSLKVDVNIPQVLTLPYIEGVDQSYLGLISGLEYLKVIRDEHGNIRKSVFYDNVRDFQGANKVNAKITATLNSAEKAAFAIRNNGITVVAKSLTRTGNQFALTDFQIVNGCQTSHVLFINAELVDESVSIPIRIVSTTNEDVTRSVVEATNSQTEVTDEQLRSLSDFQKLLEEHYRTYTGDMRLYYERRSKQYAAEAGVEKTRIVSIPTQIKSFAAVFLNDPHRAGRYFATLRRIHEDTLFRDDHRLEPYFASAYMAYRLEFMFRNNNLDTKFKAARWHILLAARAISTQQIDVPMLNSRKMEAFCKRIIADMADVDEASATFYLAAQTVESAFLLGGKALGRDDARDQESTDLVQSAIRRMIIQV